MHRGALPCSSRAGMDVLLPISVTPHLLLGHPRHLGALLGRGLIDRESGQQNQVSQRGPHPSPGSCEPQVMWQRGLRLPISNLDVERLSWIIQWGRAIPGSLKAGGGVRVRVRVMPCERDSSCTAGSEGGARGHEPRDEGGF